jgi:hypothetical protein
MTLKQINEQIERLVHAWCDRRELIGLAALLPSWIQNNGLTDGWQELAAELRHASNLRHLPDGEQDTLKQLWVELDVILRDR